MHGSEFLLFYSNTHTHTVLGDQFLFCSAYLCVCVCVNIGGADGRC